MLYPLVARAGDVGDTQDRDLALAAVELALHQDREGKLHKCVEARRRVGQHAKDIDRRQIRQCLTNIGR